MAVPEVARALLGGANCRRGSGNGASHMTRQASIQTSRALWNRSALNLDSDEVLAQILDRGELDTWRELYQLARSDTALRARILRLLSTTPLPLVYFWRAALKRLGEDVDFEAPHPDYFGTSGI